jgi:hypothetical protein
MKLVTVPLTTVNNILIIASNPQLSKQVRHPNTSKCNYLPPACFITDE